MIVKKSGKYVGNVVTTAGPAAPVPVTTTTKRQGAINNVITAIDVVSLNRTYALEPHSQLELSRSSGTHVFLWDTRVPLGHTCSSGTHVFLWDTRVPLGHTPEALACESVVRVTFQATPVYVEHAYANVYTKPSNV
jgi:hypothetical protein